MPKLKKLFRYSFLLTAIGAALVYGAFSGCTMMRLRASNPQEIGAIAESSSRLAKVITQLVPKTSPPKRILEVGAGTGVFTRKLVEKLGPDDHFDVVELMPELCEVLHEKFDNIQNVEIFCGDILKFETKKPYDYVVSGLPFNSFSADLVEKVTKKLTELAKPGALCSFFEYKWLSNFRSMSMSTQEKDEFNETRMAVETFVQKYRMFSTSVYLNIPPADVHFLRLE